MGRDLTLLPLDAGNIGSWGYSHTILRLPRDYDMQADVLELELVELLPEADISSMTGGRVPDGESAGEQMYGRLTNDPYGNKYRFARAGALAKVLAKHYPDHQTTAYVRALKPEHPVILEWS